MKTPGGAHKAEEEERAGKELIKPAQKESETAKINGKSSKGTSGAHAVLRDLKPEGQL